MKYKTGFCTLWDGFQDYSSLRKFILIVDLTRLCMNSCPGAVTHVCVGVLSLGLGQWGVTVGAVVFTEVIGSLGVGGNQQLLDVAL